MRQVSNVVECKYSNPYPIPTIEERVDMHLQEGTESLYICPDGWALRHRFIHQETGEVLRARCDSWQCSYCGPRKVDLWRQVIKEAKPVLMVTLTRAGKTMEEASRALTTWVQAMRRGSKGKGCEHEGARSAYPIEYLAVAERHSNFEEVGFHWHLLIVGVDFLPKKEVEAAWRSATHGVSWVCWVSRVRKGRAVGYVTKYLTKDITRAEQGIKLKQVEGTVVEVGEDGKLFKRQVHDEVEVKSHARRIRYSQGFFPATVKELRAQLFTRAEQQEETVQEKGVKTEHEEQGQGTEQEQLPVPSSSLWRLYEVAPATGSVDEYHVRKRMALQETLVQRQEQRAKLNRRVLGMWAYQRDERFRFVRERRVS